MTPWRPRRLGRSIPFASLTAAAVVASGGVAPAAATASEPPAGRRFTPGAPGLGDPWYPLEGNGGYTVRHYDLDLAYDPGSGRLDGTARIAARATQDLSRFDLDLRGLTVRDVTVGGRRAAYRRDGQELVVTPPRGLPDGSAFTVAVAYGGVPRPLGGDAPYGFVRTDDGAVVESVEDGASTWFPCDDHPSEKATYTFRVRVPAGLSVVANGRLVSRRTAHGATTYTWAERAPMATYLATIDIGRWTVRTGRTPGGIPEYVAADPKLAGTDPAHPAPLRHFWDTTARVTDLWTKVFGPYPFDSTGAVAVLAKYQGTTVPFSEEAQTRPVYSDADSDEVIAHELAHQWFGDSVGLTRWTEIWLSEGFATFAAWYWDERNGGTPARAQARQVYDSYPADSPFWQVVTAAPKAPDQYAGARVYLGGAMALELLRERIGDDRFFALLRAWAARHRYGNATSAEFAALANEVSGQDLGGFFHAWIFSTGKPRFPQAATALPRGHAAAAESLTKSR